MKRGKGNNSFKGLVTNSPDTQINSQSMQSNNQEMEVDDENITKSGTKRKRGEDENNENKKDANPRVTKKQRSLKRFEEKKYKEVKDSILDTMLRLLEGNDKGCTAAFISNNKIFFADNNINSSITKKGNIQVTGQDRMELIDRAMTHFGNLANTQVDTTERAQLFEDICYKKVREEAAGYIKLDEETIREMAREMLAECDQGREYKFKKGNRTSRPYRILAHTLCDSLLTDFIKVEAFIEEYSKNEITSTKKSSRKSKDSDLIVILRANNKLKIVTLNKEDTINYQDYALMHENKRIGYVILATDWVPIAEKGKKKEKLVHAEGKILNYLLFTRKYDRIYEGLSKLCCLNCALLNKAANSAKITNTSGINLAISARGEHNYVFKTGTPLLLQNNGKNKNFGEYQSISKEATIIVKDANEISKLKTDDKETLVIYIDSVAASKISKYYCELDEKHKATLEKAAKSLSSALTKIKTRPKQQITRKARLQELEKAIYNYLDVRDFAHEHVKTDESQLRDLDEAYQEFEEYYNEYIQDEELDEDQNEEMNEKIQALMNSFNKVKARPLVYQNQLSPGSSANSDNNSPLLSQQSEMTEAEKELIKSIMHKASIDVNNSAKYETILTQLNQKDISKVTTLIETEDDGRHNEGQTDNAFNNKDKKNYEYQSEDIKLISRKIIADLDFNENILAESLVVSHDGKKYSNMIRTSGTLLAKKKMLDEGDINIIVGVLNLSSEFKIDGRSVLTGHWVTFMITKDKTSENKYHIYYKDPFGTERIDSSFGEIIFNIFDQNIEIHTNNQEQQADQVNCGIYSLENLKIMLNAFKITPHFNYIDFDEIEFQSASSSNIVEKRQEFGATFKAYEEIMEKQENEKRLKKESLADIHSAEVEELQKILQKEIPNAKVEINFEEEPMQYFYRVDIYNDKMAPRAMDILKKYFDDCKVIEDVASTVRLTDNTTYNDRKAFKLYPNKIKKIDECVNLKQICIKSGEKEDELSVQKMAADIADQISEQDILILSLDSLPNEKTTNKAKEELKARKLKMTETLDKFAGVLKLKEDVTDEKGNVVQNDRWITFIIVKHKSNYELYYVDSSGKSVDKAFESLIKDVFSSKIELNIRSYHCIRGAENDVCAIVNLKLLLKASAYLNGFNEHIFNYIELHNMKFNTILQNNDILLDSESADNIKKKQNEVKKDKQEVEDSISTLLNKYGSVTKIIQSEKAFYYIAISPQNAWKSFNELNNLFDMAGIEQVESSEQIILKIDPAMIKQVKKVESFVAREEARDNKSSNDTIQKTI